MSDAILKGAFLLVFTNAEFQLLLLSLLIDAFFERGPVFGFLKMRLSVVFSVTLGPRWFRGKIRSKLIHD